MKKQTLAPLFHHATHLIALLPFTLGLSACGLSSSSNQSSTVDPRFTLENRTLDLVTAMAATISPTLTLSYTLAPPLMSQTGAVQTYAADIVIANNLVYTSFNSIGTPQAGAVDIINPGLLNAIPYIQSTQLYTDITVNRAFPFNNELWMVGAKNNIGAWVRRAPITLGAIGSADFDAALPSYAGTGVTASGSTVSITSGDSGGLSFLSASTGAAISNLNINDARSVTTLSNGDIVVLTGGSCGSGSVAGVNCNTANTGKTLPTLTRYTTGGTVVWTKTLTGATIAQSKSAVVAGGTYLAASLGDGGFSLICQADGAIMATQGAVTVSGLDPSLSVTNAVAAGPGMILAADGQAGIYLYQIQSSTTGPASSCAKVQLASMGSVNFGDGSSANNIVADSFSLSISLAGISTYLGKFYVASGVKGFRSVQLSLVLSLGTTLINL